MANEKQKWLTHYEKFSFGAMKIYTCPNCAAEFTFQGMKPFDKCDVCGQELEVRSDDDGKDHLNLSDI